MASCLSPCFGPPARKGREELGSHKEGDAGPLLLPYTDPPDPLLSIVPLLTSVILTNAYLSKHTCPNKYLIVSICENLFLFVTPAKCLFLLMSAGYAYVLTLCIC